jgi:hypothetical protein
MFIDKDLIKNNFILKTLFLFYYQLSDIQQTLFEPPYASNLKCFYDFKSLNSLFKKFHLAKRNYSSIVTHFSNFHGVRILNVTEQNLTCL